MSCLFNGIEGQFCGLKKRNNVRNAKHMFEISTLPTIHSVRLAPLEVILQARAKLLHIDHLLKPCSYA